MVFGVWVGVEVGVVRYVYGVCVGVRVGRVLVCGVCLGGEGYIQINDMGSLRF